MKNNIIKFIASLVLLALCVSSAFFFKSCGKEKYDVLYFGDSIIAGQSSRKHISDFLSENTGLSVFNAAFGGTTVSENGNGNYMGNAYSLFTMAGLSEAIARQDFSTVSLASKRNSEEVIVYWTEKAEKMSDIDLGSVKYVVIEQGINDYLQGVAVDNEDDLYDTSTFGGALRYSVRNIKEGMPDAIIIIETPLYTALYGDCESVSLGGGTLTDYIAKEKEIAREMQVLLFDAYTVSGINCDNTEEYLWDGLHTNEQADIIIAGQLSDFINNRSK